MPITGHVYCNVLTLTPDLFEPPKVATDMSIDDIPICLVNRSTEC